MVVKISSGSEIPKNMTSEKNKLEKITKEYIQCTNKPAQYLEENKGRTEKNVMLLKSLYDYAKLKQSIQGTSKTLNTLYVQNTDEEQLWQQLELENTAMVSALLEKTSKLLSISDKKYLFLVQEQNEVENQEGNAAASDVDEYENEDTFDVEGVEKDVQNNDEEVDVMKLKLKNRLKLKNANSSVLDDGFFNMNEMNNFLDAEDAKEMRKSGKQRAQEIDYFASLSDEDDADIKNIRFSDFFDDPNSKYAEVKQKKTNNLNSNDEDQEDESLEEEVEEEEEESEDYEDDTEQNQKPNDNFDDSNQFDSDEDSEASSNEPGTSKKLSEPYLDQSEFELRQARLKNTIDRMESEALNEKTWQLKGEITSSARPKNSLLEEVLEFDQTVRPAPIITEATTQCLEDIIIKRIKSKAWDDVERKIKPQNDVGEYKKQLILDQEKSKQSLAQIYEKDYISAVSNLKHPDDKQTDEPKEHTEIRNTMKSLFLKLDSLSNFHFTVKPVAVEPKILTNIPAINMEEVAPVAERDTTVLAPEEVVPSTKGGDIVGKSERTATDKNRQRRQKKLKQKSIQKQKETRLEEQKKSGFKVSTKDEKQAALEKVSKHRNVIRPKETINTKSLKASSQFFSQLQDKTLNSAGKKKRISDFKETDNNKNNAKRLKL